jgi:hypothetical protein
MTEILTLEIRLSGWRGRTREWYRAIEIPADASLEDLHCTIQDIVKFDDDHMYSFYVGRNWRRFGNEVAKAANPYDESDYAEIPLNRIYPLEGKDRLYYWFDFGDDWIFEITCRRGKKVPGKRAKYPRVIEKRGRNPGQYSR